eukprot:9224077-Lingulodinium_polyedra.AAC.1
MVARANGATLACLNGAPSGLCFGSLPRAARRPADLSRQSRRSLASVCNSQEEKRSSAKQAANLASLASLCEAGARAPTRGSTPASVDGLALSFGLHLLCSPKRLWPR